MNNPTVRYGVIAGLIVVIYNLALYIISPEMVVSFMVMLSYVAIIAFMVVGGREAKKGHTDGTFDFKAALKVTFTISVISTLIFNIFTYVLYNLIDTSLSEVSMKVSKELSITISRYFGATEEMIDKNLDSMSIEQYEITLTKSIFGYAISCIVGFIFAAFISVLIKNKTPKS